MATRFSSRTREQPVKPYRFIQEADAEFQQHIRYYDEQATGLGDQFIADVEAAVSDIRLYP